MEHPPLTVVIHGAGIVLCRYRYVTKTLERRASSEKIAALINEKAKQEKLTHAMTFKEKVFRDWFNHHASKLCDAFKHD